MNKQQKLTIYGGLFILAMAQLSTVLDVAEVSGVLDAIDLCPPILVMLNLAITLSFDPDLIRWVAQLFEPRNRG